MRSVNLMKMNILNMVTEGALINMIKKHECNQAGVKEENT